MDTKWKDRIKIFSWLILFSFGLFTFKAGIDNYHHLRRDYFDNPQFEYRLNEYISYLFLFEINDFTSEKSKASITVTEAEIEEHRYRYGDFIDQIENLTYQYEDLILEAKNNGNQALADLYIKERETKIEDITKNFQDDNHVREKIIKQKEEEIDVFINNLEVYRSKYLQYNEVFSYSLKDLETGTVYTNAPSKSFENQEMLFVRSYPFSDFHYHNYYDSYEVYYAGYGYELERIFGYPLYRPETLNGKIGVAKDAPGSSLIMKEMKLHQRNQLVFIFIFTIGTIAFLLSLYLLWKMKILNLISNKWLHYYRRIPIDVRLGIFFVTLIIIFDSASRLYFHYYSDQVYYYLRHLLIKSPIFVGIALVQGKYLFETIKDKNTLAKELNSSLLIRIYRNISDFFLVRSIATQLIILIGFFGSGLALIVFVGMVEPYYVAPFLLAFAVVCIPVFIIIFVRIGYLNRIIKNVDEIVKGTTPFDLPVKGRSVFAKLAENINTLKQGVKASQIEQLKSERLKTELITNVSHDLRTPLTSIISYTELLKGPDVSTEDQNSYIEIIDRKAKRLKVLIDDLFEASKMASGNLELVKEKVDLVQLLQQSLAEYNETMKQSTLQFRITNPDTPVYALVEGQKIWRVFDNLIENTLKYSLENTRVYISVKILQDKALISFKNITKYELGENIDELFERFKRGDASRQTEGSGLGLAIAKSIVDLHHGQLDIDVDGDLFKVSVTIPIVNRV